MKYPKGISVTLILRCQLGRKGQPSGLDKDARDLLLSWLAARGANGSFSMSDIAEAKANGYAPGEVAIVSVDPSQGCAEILVTVNKSQACRCTLTPPGKINARRKGLEQLSEARERAPAALPRQDPPETQESLDKPNHKHTLVNLYELMHLFVLEGPTIKRSRVLAYLVETGISSDGSSQDSQARNLERIKSRLRQLKIDVISQYNGTEADITIKNAPAHLQAICKLIDGPPKSAGNAGSPPRAGKPDIKDKATVVILRNQEQNEATVINRRQSAHPPIVVKRDAKADQTTICRRQPGTPDQPMGDADQAESLALAVNDYLESAAMYGHYGLHLTDVVRGVGVVPVNTVQVGEKPDSRYLLLEVYENQALHTCWLDAINEDRATDTYEAFTRLNSGRDRVAETAAPPEREEAHEEPEEAPPTPPEQEDPPPEPPTEPVPQPQPPTTEAPPIIQAVGPPEVRIPVVLQANGTLIHAWMAFRSPQDAEAALSVLPRVNIQRLQP